MKFSPNTFFQTIYCIRNDYEQIYLLVDMSSSNSYQLAAMSFNLGNVNFSEMFAAYRSVLEENRYHLITKILRSCLRSIRKCSRIFKFHTLHIFFKFSFSNSERDCAVIIIVRGQKSKSFHIEKFRFMFSIDFKHCKKKHFFIKEMPPTNYFRKSFSIFRKANDYPNEDYKS